MRNPLITILSGFNGVKLGLITIHSGFDGVKLGLIIMLSALNV